MEAAAVCFGVRAGVPAHRGASALYMRREGRRASWGSSCLEEARPGNGQRSSDLTTASMAWRAADLCRCVAHSWGARKEQVGGIPGAWGRFQRGHGQVAGQLSTAYGAL